MKKNNLDEHKSNSKYTWQILKEVINNRNIKNNRELTTFKSADCEINDPSTIAEGFCEYFSNLGPVLVAKIPGSMNTFSNFLKANVTNYLFLERTNPQEVTDICDGIRLGAAAGYDNINISVVKSTTDIISIPLAHIIRSLIYQYRQVWSLAN